MAGSWRRMVSAVLVTTVAALGTIVSTSPTQAVSIKHDFLVSANPVDLTPHVLDGEVRAITQVGNRVIVGGTFTQVRQATNGQVLNRTNIFAFNKDTFVVDTGFVPTVNAGIDALASAGDGSSVFVGGNFSTINGTSQFGVTKLNASNGQRVTAFTGTTSGRVRDLKVLGNKVYLGGNFFALNGVPRSQVGIINATTGATDPTFNIGITRERFSVPWVQKLDVSPDGSRLAIVGNFIEVNGQSRHQLALFDLTTNPATLANWSTSGYASACNTNAFWTYMRDIEFDPESDYFAIATTGGPYLETLCDTAARWEIEASGLNVASTWVAVTGGDTLWSVAITGSVVYAGGHQRWFNNHTGSDFAGPGAVSRAGIAALDPINGVPLSWNPGKDRGFGVYDIFATEDGVYIGSDTDMVAGENHPKLALFPKAGGSSVPQPTPVSLPASMFVGRANGTLGVLSYNGTTFGTETPVANNPVPWASVRGAFYENGKVYYSIGDNLFTRTYNGSAWGPETDLNTWVDWNTAAASSMTWDNGRLYYTKTSLTDTKLYYQYLSLESGIVGSRTFTISGDGDGLDWSNVAGIDIVGNHLYYATTDGRLFRINFANNDVVPGTQVQVSGVPLDTRNWNVPDFFFSSLNAAPTVSVTAPAGGSQVVGTTTVTANATDDQGVSQVEFFAGATSIGVDSNGGDGWSVQWNSAATADGSVALTARATDTGNQSTTSSPINVTVNNGVPTVEITAPADGANVTGVVPVTANASDTTGVSTVEFFAAGTSIGVDNNGGDGWGVQWNSAGSSGQVELSAVATDSGGRAASDAIQVNVTAVTPVVLLVVADPNNLVQAESIAKARLQTLGYSVTVADDNTATATSASGASFVMISASVTTGATTFRDAAVPVWVAKTYYLDDMEMTGPTSGTHYGTVSYAQVSIATPSHPMAAGRSGTVPFLTSAAKQSWGIPVAGGQVVATNSANSKPSVFAIQTGTPLDNGTPAPACRVTFPVAGAGPSRYTNDALAMFDATANYLADNCGA